SAAKILETAERLGEPTEMSILLTSGGGLHLVAGSDWPLESLQREHAAAMAFRVTRHGGSVRVDGREGLRSCRFESLPAAEAARRLLGAPASYPIAAR
ncbi:MAG TPA: hypothetical protein DEH78_20915, partial [Solibacterales bacterium]|nr:hypothetical protein [Bryobacterales bacterium]